MVYYTIQYTHVGREYKNILHIHIMLVYLVVWCWSVTSVVYYCNYFSLIYIQVHILIHEQNRQKPKIYYIKFWLYYRMVTCTQIYTKGIIKYSNNKKYCREIKFYLYHRHTHTNKACFFRPNSKTLGVYIFASLNKWCAIYYTWMALMTTKSVVSHF